MFFLLSFASAPSSSCFSPSFLARHNPLLRLGLKYKHLETLNLPRLSWSSLTTDNQLLDDNNQLLDDNNQLLDDDNQLLDDNCITLVPRIIF
jgi:hypothetical protein